tara:strand:+ start:416 stop:2281 length:1866 start_codon:yes stop_codon:yes gene_type:complete
MGADSTLVNAAFKEQISKYGTKVINLKPLYDSTASIGKTALNTITKTISSRNARNEKIRLGKESQLKTFKGVMQRNYAKLFSAKEPMPQKIIDAVDGRVRELQEEFEAVNTYGKNDTVENERARVRINGELQRVITEAVNTRATFLKLGQNLEMWNNDEISYDIIAPQTMMMDLDTIDTNDNVTINYNQKGEITFTAQNYYGDANSNWGKDGLEGSAGAVTYTISQMEGNIPSKNVKADAEILKGNNAAKNKGRSDGYDDDGGIDFDFETEKNNILADIKSEEDFQNIARRRLEGFEANLSFKEALEKSIDIPISILNNMFLNADGEMMDIGSAFAELDRSGKNGAPDGIINAEDSVGLEGEDLEVFIANFDSMIDVLTNKDNKAFDLARSKSLLGDYYTDLRKQEYEKGFKYERSKKPLKPGQAWEGSYKALPIGNGREYAPYEDGILMLNSFREAQKGNKTYFGLKGDFFTYDPNTKLWSSGPDNNRLNFEKGATTTQLIVKLGLSVSEFQAMKGTLPPPGGGGDKPLALYNNKKINNSIFAKSATESYNTFNNLNISGVIFSLEKRSGVSKIIRGEETNIMNVESGDNSIKINFGLEGVEAQKAEMKKLNDFLKQYSK